MSQFIFQNADSIATENLEAFFENHIFDTTVYLFSPVQDKGPSLFEVGTIVVVVKQHGGNPYANKGGVVSEVSEGGLISVTMYPSKRIVSFTSRDLCRLTDCRIIPNKKMIVTPNVARHEEKKEEEDLGIPEIPDTEAYIFAKELLNLLERKQSTDSHRDEQLLLLSLKKFSFMNEVLFSRILRAINLVASNDIENMKKRKIECGMYFVYSYRT